MKATEHKAIMKQVVERKNLQIQAVKEGLTEVVDFWQKESDGWLQRLNTSDALLEKALKEFEYLFNQANNNIITGPNEVLMSEIKKHLSKIY